MKILKICILFLSTPVALFTEKLNLGRQKKRFNKGKVIGKPLGYRQESNPGPNTRPRRYSQYATKKHFENDCMQKLFQNTYNVEFVVP